MGGFTFADSQNIAALAPDDVDNIAMFTCNMLPNRYHQGRAIARNAIRRYDIVSQWAVRLTAAAGTRGEAYPFGKVSSDQTLLQRVADSEHRVLREKEGPTRMHIACHTLLSAQL